MLNPNAQQWVDALRSGEYGQGFGVLHSSDKFYRWQHKNFPNRPETCAPSACPDAGGPSRVFWGWGVPLEIVSGVPLV